MSIRKALIKNGIAHLYNKRLCDMTVAEIKALSKALAE